MTLGINIMEGLIEKLDKLYEGVKPASPDSIKSIEERYNITLSGDLLSLFENITGNEGIQIEHVFVNGPDKFKPVNEYLHEDDMLDDNKLYFAIADFDDWCWGYVVDTVDREKTAVYMFRDKNTELLKVADSLSDFIYKSIETNPILLGAEE